MKRLGCIFLGMRIFALAQTSGTGALTGTVRRHHGSPLGQKT